MLYKYETHMHSSKGSLCGKSTTEAMVRAYHAAGYSGAVLTDHFINGNTAVPRDLPWAERMQMYYDSFLEAKPIADELDFDLHFGIEHEYGGHREILIYGISIDFLKENNDIPDISVEEFARRIHAAGGFISHAHPNRFRPAYMREFVEPNVTICDALEVFNYTDPQEFNDKTNILADKLGFYKTSGTDVHFADFEGIGQAGLAFPRRLRRSEELAAALHAHEGKLIIRGEIID